MGVSGLTIAWGCVGVGEHVGVVADAGGQGVDVDGWSGDGEGGEAVTGVPHADAGAAAGGTGAAGSCDVGGESGEGVAGAFAQPRGGIVASSGQDRVEDSGGEFVEVTRKGRLIGGGGCRGMWCLSAGGVGVPGGDDVEHGQALRPGDRTGC